MSSSSSVKMLNVYAILKNHKTQVSERDEFDFTSQLWVQLQLYFVPHRTTGMNQASISK